MAWGNEVIDKTKVGMGHLVFRIKSNTASSSGGKVKLGRVVEISDIETGKALYEHRGGNSDGSSQIVALFETMKPTMKFRVTLDELHDFDTETSYGEQVDVDIVQSLPKASSKCVRLLMPKAYLNPVSMKLSKETPSTQVIEVTPYNDPGTAVATVDIAYTYA